LGVAYLRKFYEVPKGEIKFPEKESELLNGSD